MSTDGRPNTGPLDFFYLLKRRGVSFERWCQSLGIRTKTDFLQKKSEVESQGEHFFPPEMVVLANALPEPQETPSTKELVRIPTIPPPASPDPVEAQEEVVSPKKAKKTVST
jgi:hypothetical protein